MTTCSSDIATSAQSWWTTEELAAERTELIVKKLRGGLTDGEALRLDSITTLIEKRWPRYSKVDWALLDEAAALIAELREQQ